MERILVTGSAGFLGSNMVWYAREKYEVIATTVNPIEVEGYHLEKLDACDRSKCFTIIEKYKPSVVVHCGTRFWFTLEDCEEKHMCDKINLECVKNLVDACKKVNSRFVFVSSDWVFDGKKEPGDKYTETDPPAPLNAYGKSKLECEEVIQESGLHWIIIRPANIFGNSFAIPKDKSLLNVHMKNRGGFTQSVITSLSNNKEILQPSDIFQTPTYARTFAEVVMKLHENNQKGIFHVACRTAISRYDFVREVADVFDLNSNLVKKADEYAFAESLGVDLKKNPVEFPKNACMDVSKIERTLKITMPTLREGLKDMKKQRNTELAS